MPIVNKINLQKRLLVDNNHFVKLMIKDDGTIIGIGAMVIINVMLSMNPIGLLITLIKQSYIANK